MRVLLSTFSLPADSIAKTEALPWSNIAFMHKLRNEHSDQHPMEPLFLKVQARLTFIKKDQEKPPWSERGRR